VLTATPVCTQIHTALLKHASRFAQSFFLCVYFYALNQPKQMIYPRIFWVRDGVAVSDILYITEDFLLAIGFTCVEHFLLT